MAEFLAIVEQLVSFSILSKEIRLVPAGRFSRSCSNSLCLWINHYFIYG